MSLSSATVWEDRAGAGNDNNGGGWTAGGSGTDYSQANSPILSVIDGVVNGTTTVTSATGGFTAAMVDNLMNIVGVGFFRITAFTNTNTVTVDRSPGTGTNQHINVGGALATLGTLAGTIVGSNLAYATGSFTASTTTTFSPSGTTAAPTRLLGYGSTRGDGTHARLTLQTNTGLTGLSMQGSYFDVRYFDVDCGSLGTSTAFTQNGNGCSVTYCKAANFTSVGFQIGGGNNLRWAFSEATGGTSAATAAFNTNPRVEYILGCNAHDNACPGFVASSLATFQSCLSVNNSGASSDGFRVGDDCRVINCTAHNNGRHGIFHNGTSVYGQAWLNNILTSNGGYGISGSSGTAIPADAMWDGNAYWNNTSGARTLMDDQTGINGVNPYTNVRDVTLTASPYVGPTTGSTANFGLNNTAGAGAACRAKGTPGTWPGNTGTTSYSDMGAVQHQDTPGPPPAPNVVRGDRFPAY